MPRAIKAFLAGCLISLILGAASSGGALHAQADSSGCLRSSWPKPSLAWQPGAVGSNGALPGDELFVQVVAVRELQPIAHARVFWSPGDRYLLTDSTGTVHIRSLRQGRYQLRVGAIGFMEATDSITLGFDGLRVVAVLTSVPFGDVVCTSVRKPSNVR